MKPSGLLWILTVVQLVASQPGIAQKAQESAQEVAERLNEEGIRALRKGDIERAGGMVEEALRIAKAGKVTKETRATSYANLGAIYLDGLKDAQSAAGLLLVARCLDPHVKFSESKVSADARKALEASEERAEALDCAEVLASAGEGEGAGKIDKAEIKLATLVHVPPAQQQVQTPLPLYAELNHPEEVEQVVVYFRGPGMEEFERAPMYVFGRGLAYQISCSYFFAPSVSYYLVALDDDEQVLATAGSAEAPFEVVVETEPPAEPAALPGRAAPAACAVAECPPGVKCHQRGAAALGDACSSNLDCQPGLSCEHEQCLLAGADSTDVDDLEWSEEAGVSVEPPPRYFASISLALSLPWLTDGMPADREPDPNEVFVDVDSGAYVALDGNENLDRLVLPDPDSVAPQFHADRVTEWVPDSDSNDSLSGGAGIGGRCPGDGIRTGPGFDKLLPSSYCVRVRSPGFVPVAALRFAFGYYFTERLAGSIVGRFQFSGGEGLLAQLLFGVRAEYALFGKPRSEGFYPTLFAGLTMGELQVQPSFDRVRADAPWAESGILGAHIGGNLRYRLHRNFGLIASPELDLQFPNMLFNIELPVGVELAF